MDDRQSDGRPRRRRTNHRRDRDDEARPQRQRGDPALGQGPRQRARSTSISSSRTARRGKSTSARSWSMPATIRGGSPASCIARCGPTARGRTSSSTTAVLGAFDAMNALCGHECVLSRHGHRSRLDQGHVQRLRDGDDRDAGNGVSRRGPARRPLGLGRPGVQAAAVHVAGHVPRDRLSRPPAALSDSPTARACRSCCIATAWSSR